VQIEARLADFCRKIFTSNDSVDPVQFAKIDHVPKTLSDNKYIYLKSEPRLSADRCMLCVSHARPFVQLKPVASISL
jgi:hypothetical protein